MDERCEDDAKNSGLLRRRAVIAGATASGVLALASSVDVSAQAGDTPMRTPRTLRQPAVYLPHGGGPWPFVDVGIGDPRELENLATYLRSLGTGPRPRALLVISAHWEERLPTVSTAEAPPMLYDYYGFPAESYRIRWPAPGDPSLARRVRALLADAGLESAEDPTRGFDHGTFVPMKLAFPAAEVPTVQLSLVRGLDPDRHLAIGRAIAPLRDEGVLIVGSGMSYHNLRGFGPWAAPVAETFDAWLRNACARPPREREERLGRWHEAPMARQAHPREEHLLPLMVVVGAAGDDMARLDFDGTLVGLRLSAFRFG